MKSVLLQASGDPAIFAYIFALVIIIGAFFALRSVILWYYKLDSISKNLDDQTKLLTEISSKLDHFINTEKSETK